MRYIRSMNAASKTPREIAAGLPRAQAEFLTAAVDLTKWDGFDGLTSNRLYRKREGDALVVARLCTCEMMKTVDGDGFGVEPERYGPAYKPTPLGRQVAAEVGQ